MSHLDQSAARRIVDALPTQRVPGDGMTRGELDVIAERRRQVNAEGWTPEHDDEHDAGELAAAGSAYAIAAADALHPLSQGDGHFDEGPPLSWPWGRAWWKPGAARRMLVKAAALLLAEIDKIDRREPR